ncbi:polysaccharide lyase family protein [Paucibacter sp. PLA-PC-4]|uniref:rhamnogalacturonan lyase B N-terminal domain-containing protein n=1 Tax=Paucibacter sp. PLA-PC-4 TaxID=2993655 RepID=UPI00224B2E98|nr:rhamnogalacturonan lyase B N-terminal domain-containing protein [Paucibacter sp. PLA-PC-4]MCX2865057.1 polysaccharide lyase family protein [Paucibacter sp. PLA-PC-4]
MRKQELSLVAALLLATAGGARAEFGLSADALHYTVDTGAGLVFKLRRTDTGASIQSIGDIASLRYKGIELQDANRGSHIASGFDTIYSGISAVSLEATQPDADTIQIAVRSGGLTHYYLARRGLPMIAMATHVTAQPTVGELRWISRLRADLLTGVPPESDLRGSSGAIESSDVFGFASGANQGQSRSKYYGNERALDYGLRGVTGNGVGVFMAYGQRERASGGPFFRDIQNQTGTNTELYNYMNSGHNQTEPFRMGLHGPYALLFTDGSTPSLPDLGWVDGLGLLGHVSALGRGGVTVAGLSGRDPNHVYTVGFANSAAQYWTNAHPVDGSFSRSGMLPGDYTMTVYKNELAVHSRSVTVAANTSYALNPLSITGDPSATPALWRIGDWDGTPRELLNGARLTGMHPSDVRMSPWTALPFVVGRDASAAFPAYQWKDVNGRLQIRFMLRRGQVMPYRLRIGLTAAYNGARPKLQVNGWVSGNPASSTQPRSRSLTIGTYRGNNALYQFDIPAAELVVGENLVTIEAISGTAGSGFTSPGYAIDAIDLVRP